MVIRQHWDSRAATFDEYVGHGLHSEAQRQAWLDVLVSLVDAPPQRVLDIGCGTGFLSLMFAELGHRVTGVDLAPQMLELARQKAKQAKLDVEFRLENAATINDPDGSYDLAVARHVIWLLPDPAGAVDSWMRVLRSNGRLALIEGKWASNELMEKHSRSRETAVAAVAYAVLSTASRIVGRARWRPLFQRIYGRLYPRIEAKLPFAGGPPAEKLVQFLEEHGLRDISVEPLMDPALWGETPRFPRYLAVGKR